MPEAVGRGPQAGHLLAPQPGLAGALRFASGALLEEAGVRPPVHLDASVLDGHYARDGVVEQLDVV